MRMSACWWAVAFYCECSRLLVSSPSLLQTCGETWALKLPVAHSQQPILVSHLPCPPAPAEDVAWFPAVVTVTSYLPADMLCKSLVSLSGIWLAERWTVSAGAGRCLLWLPRTLTSSHWHRPRIAPTLDGCHSPELELSLAQAVTKTPFCCHWCGSF